MTRTLPFTVLVVSFSRASICIISGLTVNPLIATLPFTFLIEFLDPLGTVTLFILRVLLVALTSNGETSREIVIAALVDLNFKALADTAFNSTAPLVLSTVKEPNVPLFMLTEPLLLLIASLFNLPDTATEPFDESMITLGKFSGTTKDTKHSWLAPLGSIRSTPALTDDSKAVEHDGSVDTTAALTAEVVTEDGLFPIERLIEVTWDNSTSTAAAGDAKRQIAKINLCITSPSVIRRYLSSVMRTAPVGDSFIILQSCCVLIFKRLSTGRKLRLVSERKENKGYRTAVQL